MMTKITSRKMLWLKIGGLLPLLIVAVLLFSTHVLAEQKNESILVSLGVEQDIKTPGEGLTKEGMAEFDKLVEKYISGRALDFDKMTKKEQERFKSLIDNMSEEQLKKTPLITTVRYVPPREKEGNGVSQELFDEYNSILEKHQTSDGEFKGIQDKMTDSESLKLRNIYKEMTNLQRDKVEIAVVEESLTKKIPTTEQFASWKNAKTFGIWIDGKQVDNTELDQYSTSDFSHYNVSQLKSTAKNYGRYAYEVNLMTNKGFQDYLKSGKSERISILHKGVLMNKTLSP